MLTLRMVIRILEEAQQSIARYEPNLLQRDRYIRGVHSAIKRLERLQEEGE